MMPERGLLAGVVGISLLFSRDFNAGGYIIFSYIINRIAFRELKWSNLEPTFCMCAYRMFFCEGQWIMDITYKVCKKYGYHAECKIFNKLFSNDVCIVLWEGRVISCGFNSLSLLLGRFSLVLNICDHCTGSNMHCT